MDPGPSLAGQGDWAYFVFFGVIFSKIFKHQAQGICGQLHQLKKPMLAYGENMPRNNQFFWFFCPEKIKYYPEKKSAQIYPKGKNLPSHLVQPLVM